MNQQIRLQDTLNDPIPMPTVACKDDGLTFSIEEKGGRSYLVTWGDQEQCFSSGDDFVAWFMERDQRRDETGRSYRRWWKRNG